MNERELQTKKQFIKPIPVVTPTIKVEKKIENDKKEENDDICKCSSYCCSSSSSSSSSCCSSSSSCSERPLMGETSEIK